jgi:hypothetical protein
VAWAGKKARQGKAKAETKTWYDMVWHGMAWHARHHHSPNMDAAVKTEKGAFAVKHSKAPVLHCCTCFRSVLSL